MRSPTDATTIINEEAVKRVERGDHHAILALGRRDKKAGQLLADKIPSYSSCGVTLRIFRRESPTVYTAVSFLLLAMHDI